MVRVAPISRVEMAPCIRKILPSTVAVLVNMEGKKSSFSLRQSPDLHFDHHPILSGIEPCNPFDLRMLLPAPNSGKSMWTHTVIHTLTPSASYASTTISVTYALNSTKMGRPFCWAAHFDNLYLFGVKKYANQYIDQFEVYIDGKNPQTVDLHLGQWTCHTITSYPAFSLFTTTCYFQKSTQEIVKSEE